jgi:hypothetical protein
MSASVSPVFTRSPEYIFVAEVAASSAIIALPRESNRNPPGAIASSAENVIFIFSDTLSSSHPESCISIEELFFSSIHSAEDDDGVPIHAISFKIIFRVVEEIFSGNEHCGDDIAGCVEVAIVALIEELLPASIEDDGDDNASFCSDEVFAGTCDELARSPTPAEAGTSFFCCAIFFGAFFTADVDAVPDSSKIGIDNDDDASSTGGRSATETASICAELIPKIVFIVSG